MDEIIIHMIIIAPLTKWLIGSNRRWNKGKHEYGIYLALLLLCGVGVYELRKSDQNYYEILNLNSKANKVDIQQSFRKMTRIYHPDKNKNANSLDDFNRIREAYEVLSNEKKKDYYDRFGDFGESEITTFFYVEIIIISIFHFAISFIFGFLYTYGKDNEMCRMIICLYITLNFCIEIVFRFSPESTEFLAFLPIFCRYAPFERIQAFRVLSPLVMNVILLLDIYFFDDDDDSYFYTNFCDYIFEKNTKIIKNYEDAIMTYARAIDGIVETNSNFSWRKTVSPLDTKQVYALTAEETYEPKLDNNDIFLLILNSLLNNNKQIDIDMKVPKKELCRRIDWSRAFIQSVYDENKKQKDFVQSTTTKGIIFSSAIYFIGLVSHLLSK